MPQDPVIDPVQYGALTAQVATLERQMQDLTHKVEQLLELANKSKGGFWAGMTIASALGALVHWFLSGISFPPR